MASKKEPTWNPVPSNRSFLSQDSRFGLTIGRDNLTKILQLCLVAGRLETGGILVGNYNERHDVAHVSDASGPPDDSKNGTTWFRRGVQGLQEWLHALWSVNCFYLGEWHFHPQGKPIPSPTDTTQIKEISLSRQYGCPEPILMIIGGELPSAWEIKVYVWPRGGSLMKLEDCGVDLGRRTERRYDLPVKTA